MIDLFRTRQSNNVAQPTDNDLEVSVEATISKFNDITRLSQEDEQNMSQSNTPKSLRPCRHRGGKHVNSNGGSYRRTRVDDQLIEGRGETQKQPTWLMMDNPVQMFSF
jgi:hypothetical protein